MDVRGIANPGPMVKYSNIVKKYANFLPAGLAISKSDWLSDIAAATTPSIGSPTPDNKNPKVTGPIL